MALLEGAAEHGICRAVRRWCDALGLGRQALQDFRLHRLVMTLSQRRDREVAPDADGQTEQHVGPTIGHDTRRHLPYPHQRLLQYRLDVDALGERAEAAP